MSEALKFSVTISGTYWDKKPQYSIWIDDHPVIQTEIVSDKPQVHNFTRDLDIGTHVIKIRLENKTSQDTKVENGEIVGDMLLNVDDIKIDDISLGHLMWNANYELDQQQQYQGKEIDHLDNCVNLGWNGTYILTFDSPFYIWLLENL
jgi:hypothetical protein